MGKKPKSNYEANADIAGLKRELKELQTQVEELQVVFADLLVETTKTAEVILEEGVKNGRNQDDTLPYSMRSRNDTHNGRNEVSAL